MSKYIQQQIVENLKNFDTFRIEEVLDFVEFIQHKHTPPPRSECN
jgi:hypothetical protein